jgi:hypothetical protein
MDETHLANGRSFDWVRRDAATEFGGRFAPSEVEVSVFSSADSCSELPKYQASLIEFCDA